MKFSDKKIQSFIKVHGGKNRYARQYLAEMNAEGMMVYCEPYCAGGGVGMNIVPGTFDREIFNDIDTNITRCLNTLKLRLPEVIDDIREISYSKESFDISAEYIGHSHDVTHAVNYIIRNRMSSGGMFDRFAESDRLRGGQMGDKNAWDNFINKHLEITAERIKQFDIYNGNALEIINGLQLIHHKVVYFLDPPYLHETRVSKSAYFHEVDRQHHVDLLNLITRTKGRFYLCGYYSDLYNDHLVKKHGWRFHSFERPTDSGRTKNKSRRIEYLWYSPSCWEAT